MITLIILLAIFFALFGKYIRKLISFIIKIGIKTIIYIVIIILILSALLSKAQSYQIDTSYVKLLREKVINNKSMTTNYDNFWNNRKPIEKNNYIETKKTNNDSIEKEIKENYKEIITNLKNYTKSKEFEENKNKIKETTKIIVKIIGKISATIYYNGENYFKIGSYWFDDGWKEVENKDIIKELNNYKK